MLRRLSQSRALMSALSVVLMLAILPMASAQDTGLYIDALLQEADLLRNELSRLDAAGRALAQEARQLDAAESALRVDSHALSEDIQRFNVAMKKVEQTAAAHRARCPRASEDAALVESCNAQAAQIQAEAKQLEGERLALQQKQKDLNQRVEQQNAARRNWAARNHVHDSQVGLTRRDVGDWVQRAQTFFESTEFRTAAASAGNPSSCADEALQDLDTRPAVLAIEWVEECLLALKANR